MIFISYFVFHASTERAMLSTYHMIKRSFERNKLNYSEKDILKATLKARATYKNLSDKEVEEIVLENDTIEKLTLFVKNNEKNRF